MSEETCPHCGALFVKGAVRQRFCTRECQKAYVHSKRTERVEQQCECGATYTLSAQVVARATHRGMCQACAREEAAKARSSTRRCLVCGEKFRGLIAAEKVCSAVCAAAAATVANRPKKFAAVSAETIAAQARFANKVPCAECEHGVRSAYADTGWECELNARTCAPFTFRRLFKEKQQ
jgi:hypothetical protein